MALSLLFYRLTEYTLAHIIIHYVFFLVGFFHMNAYILDTGPHITKEITGLDEKELKEILARRQGDADTEEGEGDDSKTDGVPVPGMSDLAPLIAEKLQQLIDDCVNYLRWVCVPYLLVPFFFFYGYASMRMQ